MVKVVKKPNVENKEYVDTNVKEFLRGYTDSEGAIHKEFEFREMDGGDEEAISRSNVKGSGSKVIHTVLERCIVRIGTILKAETKAGAWSALIKSLDIADQDFAILEIRRLSVREAMTVKHRCTNPDCKKELTTELEVGELECVPFCGEDTIPFELKKGYRDKDGNLHTTGLVRFPQGLDREILEPIAKNNIGLANTLMLSRITVELGTLKQVTDAVMRSLTCGDREIIMTTLNENGYGYKFEVEVTCPECGNQFVGQLSAINFI